MVRVGEGREGSGGDARRTSQGSRLGQPFHLSFSHRGGSGHPCRCGARARHVIMLPWGTWEPWNLTARHPRACMYPSALPMQIAQRASFHVHHSLRCSRSDLKRLHVPQTGCLLFTRTGHCWHHLGGSDRNFILPSRRVVQAVYHFYPRPISRP